jgi:DNA primase
MKVWPMGATHELFDWQMFKGATHLHLCEGEFDCLVLLSKGIPAITSTGGCGTFKAEWVKEFSSLESVCVCYDNDTEGEKGATRVLDALKSIDTLRRLWKSLSRPRFFTNL